MLPNNGSIRKYVDLHIHTTFSDGSYTVKEVMEAAVARGLSAISITDHDCTDAYPLALQLGRSMGIEVIPGVELSSDIQGTDIHILGYYVDITCPALINKLKEMKAARYLRAQKIVSNLNKQGVDLRFDTVLSVAGLGAIGRPHIAAAMLKEELVYSFREAFEKYIGYGLPAYVEKLKMQPREVFDLVKQAGGIPVLAHPAVTKVDERIPEFIRDGLMGIEVYHPEHPRAAERHYLKICKKYHLAYTGGSDFHYSANHHKSDIGLPRTPGGTVKSLKQKLVPAL
ncbi:PHP domain-containing protein [Chitinispirillales bacterium ANBcel5]|uniref:PHP domain-containing protein n=1 Tax=Cellulosispirillum alkaliphilum TaxID=3039283 RepID=UPI002A5711CB|nr:PHP domain-containing protein [Chitinispirillales bacterium ANBcel5]